MENGELVLTGYAKTLTIPPDITLADILSNLQKKAQNKHVGLWNPNTCKTTHTTVSCGSYTCSYNAYNCKDFKTHSQAQYVYDCCKKKVGYDIHRLDRDKDGVACESLPD